MLCFSSAASISVFGHAFGTRSPKDCSCDFLCHRKRSSRVQWRVEICLRFFAQNMPHPNRYAFRGISKSLHLSKLCSTDILLMFRNRNVYGNQRRIRVYTKRLLTNIRSGKQTLHRPLLICPLSIRVLPKKLSTRDLFRKNRCRHLLDSDFFRAPHMLHLCGPQS